MVDRHHELQTETRAWLRNVKHQQPEDFEDPQVREVFKRAQLVFGYDRSRGEYSLFYGRDALDFVGSHGETQNVRICVVNYDQRTEQLEWLAALCKTLLGRCDYRRREP